MLFKVLPPLLVSQHALGHELEGEQSEWSSTFFGAYTPCSIITSSLNIELQKTVKEKWDTFINEDTVWEDDWTDWKGT